MASNRDDPLTFQPNPSISISSSSSPIIVSSSDPLDSFLNDPRDGGASGSFQNDGGGILSGDTSNSNSSSSDLEFGFSRSDFGEARQQLVGTVELYDRHVFLCYKNPRVWPSRIDAAEFDRLPRLLSAAVSARKPDIKKQTRLTICEGHDGTETSNGDVLIFPDMVRYRRLTHFDVDTFVEEVLVKDSEWLPMTPEPLKGSYIFVCCHGSRDRRCGVCGPALVNRFRDEIELHGLLGKVSVSPCSHIGGHKYAGNVIIFGPNANGEVTGHWYGYVTPDDVTALLELHIGKGEIIDRLWRDIETLMEYTDVDFRGQMGVSEEEQRESQKRRLQMNGDTNVQKDANGHAETETNSLSSTFDLRSQVEEVMGCCQQENGNSSCCRNTELPEKTHSSEATEVAKKVSTEKKKSGRKLLSRINSSGKGSSTHRVCSMPTWLDSWEREDTYAALAVACAALSVAVAYSCYKQLR